MPKYDKLIYIVTHPVSINVFGKYQIKSVTKYFEKVEVLCGNGHIDPKVFELVDGCHTVTSLIRRISLKNDIICFFRFIRIFRVAKPSVIIYSTPKASLFASIAGRILRVEHRIFQVWGIRWINYKGLKRKFFLILDYLIILNSTSTTAVSKSVAAEYQKSCKLLLRVLGEGSTIGVDSNIFKPTEKHRSIKIRDKIGFIGRISNDKGITTVVSLISEISRIYPNIKFEIIGDSVDSADKIHPDDLSYLKSNPRVEWIKYLTEEALAAHINSWKLQIFPSLREGLGNVIIEAAACGVPSVCWDIVGVRDAVPKFLHLNLIEPKRFDLFLERVLFLIENPLSEQQMRQLSNWTVDNFEREHVLEDFSKYVGSIIGGQKDVI
jgi:glycosyltransferase involved in cell wall biosynthesis